MKRFFFLIALLICIIGANAAQIAVSKAKVKAGANARLVYTAKTAEKPDFYVFQKTQGFTIVAADDVIGDVVLGYAEEGTFDYDRLPDNAKWWLSQYQEEIEYLRQNKDAKPRLPKAEEGASSSYVVVAPLLGDIKWDQDNPYNILCPEVGGEKCLTGCGATSMAMIMKYYNWPLKGKGKHTDTWTDDTKTRRSVTVDFSQSEYDWTNMLGTYYDYNEAQANAVARLMYDCGVSIDMMYGPYGSSAYTGSQVEPLYTYFSYKKETISYAIRSWYDNNTWEQKLKNELDARRPILYDGQASKGGGGHAFVCDGYDSNGYFHFNFGWSGRSNGWFLSSVADGYDTHQGAILGIIPDREQPVVGDLCYNILGSDKVEVTRPVSTADYKGKIEIPSVITIDSQQYDVVGIATQAFAGCTELTSIVIPSSITTMGGHVFRGCIALDTIWMDSTKPLNILETSLFDIGIYNDATLVVPENSISDYLGKAPWSCFADIVDTKGNAKKSNAWNVMDSGHARYYYSNPNTFDNSGADNLDVYERMISDKESQILVDHWGADVQLLMTRTMATNKIQIPEQYTGFAYGDYGRVMVASSNLKSGTYDVERGIMILPLEYFLPDTGYTLGTSTDSLFFTGKHVDYTIAVKELKTAIDNQDGSGSQVVSLYLGADVPKIKYVVIPTYIKSTEADTVAAQIADGRIQAQEFIVEKGRELTVTYPRSGKYSIVMLTFADDDTPRFSAYAKNTYVAYSGWNKLGKAIYKDDFVSSVFTSVKQYEYSLDVEENANFPGRYRIKNPYGKAYSPNADGKKTSDNVNVYMEIDATDPTAIFIPENQDMNVNLNAKTYGEMSVSSLAAQEMAAGKTLEEVKAEGLCGYFEESVIKFPQDVLLVYFPLYSAEWVKANIHGSFKLDMTGLVSGITPIIVKDATINNSTTYNLNGVKVNANYKGIVIKNGKRYIQK